MTDIEIKFAQKTQKIIEYKKIYLQLPHTPIELVGNVDVEPLAKFLKELPMMRAFPSGSAGFAGMSEYLTKNDLDTKPLYASDTSKKLDSLIEPIATEVKRIISNKIDHPVMIVRGVIDTIDEKSCIIPHSDGFIFHKYSFRVHVPLFITEKSIGVNFDPWSCKPYSWKMKTVGGIYIFNNFEPHTVSVLDEGVRAHLILDVSVADLLADCNDYHEAKKLLSSRGKTTTEFFGPNTITHSISNYTIRNKLGYTFAGLAPKENLLSQATDESIIESRTWIKELLNFELNNGNVRHI